MAFDQTPAAMAPVVRSELDRCRPLIEQALARQALFTFADVEARLNADTAQLWPGRQSCVVTYLQDLPGGRVIQTWLAAGDLDELVEELLPQIEVWAREVGCTRAMIEGGRKGFEPALKARGFEFAGVVLMKDLRA